MGIETRWFNENWEAQGEYIQARLNDDIASGFYILLTKKIAKKHLLGIEYDVFEDLDLKNSDAPWYDVTYTYLYQKHKAKITADFRMQKDKDVSNFVFHYKPNYFLINKELQMVKPQEWLEFGQKFHGHKCPAMPMGLRVGAAAMNALGVERAADGQLLTILDLGEDHCATCFADGIQVITGSTYGKGNISRSGKGKWAVTVIDKKSQKAVRVTPKAEAMLANKQTSFFKDYREVGIPASQVPDEVVEPLVVKVMSAPDEMIMNISEVMDYKHQDPIHSFSSFVCQGCGEMTVEEYGRIKGEKHLCIDCAKN